MALTRQFTDPNDFGWLGASTTHWRYQGVSYELAVCGAGCGTVEAAERSGLRPAPGRGAATVPENPVGPAWAQDNHRWLGPDILVWDNRAASGDFPAHITRVKPG
jgi:hypothetical protein